jgi:hypothetical protein
MIAVNTKRRHQHLALRFDSLEARTLMSATGIEKPARADAAIVTRLHTSAFGGDWAGKAAILNAILGGAGHEFVELAEKEIPNIFAVASIFSSSTPHQYWVRGLVAKTPNLQSGYTGLPHDVLFLTVGGGILLKHKEIELAAIARGPFTTTPFSSEIVFALNRGEGATLGPIFPERPNITPDALVTVTVGPNGRNNSATITDLTTGTTVPLSPSLIQVDGPVVRLLVSEKQLPPKGFTPEEYKFAVYSQLYLNAPFDDTGSFVPEDSMIPLGVLTDVNPPKL